MKGLLGRFFIHMIRGYQMYISPRYPPRCRFTPTCSQYAIEAISTHGAIKGLLLAFWRIIRCNPFCRGGYDPVPPKKGGAEGTDGAECESGACLHGGEAPPADENG